MTNDNDKEEYAKYVKRTILGENGVSKHEMLSFEQWLWNNKPYENNEQETEKLKSELKEAMTINISYGNGEDVKHQILDDKILEQVSNFWLKKIAEREAESREKLIKEINNLFHEVQQDSMPLGNEDWKEGYNKALYDVQALFIKNKEE